MPLQRIGILGGTFDPVHFGHLRLAIEFRDALAESDGCVHLLPCHIPPHRDMPLANSAQRLAMLELAITGHNGFRIDTRELESDAPSYSVDTLESLKYEFPSAQLVLAVGADAFADFRRWHRWEDILGLASVVVSTRPGGSIESSEVQDLLRQRQVPISELSEAGQIAQLQMTAMDISSSFIRQLIVNGESLDFLLPDAVIHYIHELGLYRPK